jgi:hypothetical protein
VQVDRELGGVGVDEVDVQLAAARQRAGLLQRSGREIRTDDARAAARERDRVEADVALQVQDVEPRDRADGLAHAGGLGLVQ